MAVIVSDVLHYVWQMLPMCLLALIVFLGCSAPKGSAGWSGGG